MHGSIRVGFRPTYLEVRIIFVSVWPYSSCQKSIHESVDEKTAGQVDPRQ